MKTKSTKKAHRKLARHVGTRTLVEIWRKSINDASDIGFVVGLSDGLVLLHVLDGNHLRLGGYSALRLKDVSRCRVVTNFIAEAVVLFEAVPERPRGVDCSNWSILVQTAEIAFPLVTIEGEKRWPGRLLIGRIRARKKRSISMDSIDIDAKWERPRRFRFRDITRVTFGDGYAMALAAVVNRARGLTYEGD
jgi:hypothetical protein